MLSIRTHPNYKLNNTSINQLKDPGYCETCGQPKPQLSEFNFNLRSVTVKTPDGKTKVNYFTSNEWSFLRVFLSRPKVLLCRNILFNSVYTFSRNDLPQEKLVDVIICHIRKRLKGS